MALVMSLSMIAISVFSFQLNWNDDMPSKFNLTEETRDRISVQKYDTGFLGTINTEQNIYFTPQSGSVYDSS